MQTKQLKVVAQTKAVKVPSKNSDSGEIAKGTLRLRELGGDYTDEYVCTVWGAMAEAMFEPGQLVTCALRFSSYEASNGQRYQEITASDFYI